MNEIDKDAFAARMQDLMSALMRAVLRSEKGELMSGALSFPQLGAMMFLAEHPLCSMNELAGALDHSLSAVSGLVDRMVKNGWIRRERSPDDRRVVRVSLTEQGRRILQRVLMERRRTYMRLFAPLNDGERAQYLALMEKVVKQSDYGWRMQDAG